MKNALFQTERIIKALAKNYTHEKTAAIILAAGKGTRAGGDVSKQLTEINGIPVAVRTIIKFQNCNIIDDIIIVAAENELGFYDEYIKKYDLSKVGKIIAGGSSRAESAKNGFYSVD